MRKGHPTLIGCYKDDAKRDLKFPLGSDTDPATCFQRAAKNGNKYAGLQNGHECYGSDSYGKYGPADKDDCNIRCDSDPTMICGGGYRNSVFDVTGVDPTPIPKKYLPKYLGCWKDSGENRALRNVISMNTTPSKCFDAALKAGFKYAALQYG